MKEEEILSRLGICDYDFRIVLGRTRIDYDTTKEEENRKKHGYSLESAVYILEKEILPIISVPIITSYSFREKDEVRHLHMGVDDVGEVVLFVTTMRPNETIRVISLRRASKKEREIFYKHTRYKKSK